MIRYPVPAVIVSALHPQSPARLFEYFQIGAVDYLPKPTAADDPEIYGARLREMVRGAAKARVTHFRRCRKPVRDLLAGRTETPENAPIEKVLVVLGAEGAHMDWFRLPLAEISSRRLAVGLLRLTEELLPGFCRLLENWTGAKVASIDGCRSLERGCFHWGNPPGSVNLGLAPPGEAIEVDGQSPPTVDWMRDAARWIEQLAEQAGEGLALYCMSGALGLPESTAAGLLENGGRLLTAPRERVVCTALVESVEPYAALYPDQVLCVAPEELARALR